MEKIQCLDQMLKQMFNCWAPNCWVNFSYEYWMLVHPTRHHCAVRLDTHVHNVLQWTMIHYRVLQWTILSHYYYIPLYPIHAIVYCMMLGNAALNCTKIYNCIPWWTYIYNDMNYTTMMYCIVPHYTRLHRTMIVCSTLYRRYDERWHHAFVSYDILKW